MMFYSLGQQYSSHDGFFGELFFHSKARLALFAYLQQCLCLLGMDASVFFFFKKRSAVVSCEKIRILSAAASKAAGGVDGDACWETLDSLRAGNLWSAGISRGYGHRSGALLHPCSSSDVDSLGLAPFVPLSILHYRRSQILSHAGTQAVN